MLQAERDYLLMAGGRLVPWPSLPRRGVLKVVDAGSKLSSWSDGWSGQVISVGSHGSTPAVDDSPVVNAILSSELMGIFSHGRAGFSRVVRIKGVQSTDQPWGTDQRAGQDHLRLGMRGQANG